MKENVELYDVVALTVDLPEYKLKRSYVGTIVRVLQMVLFLKWSSAIVREIPMPHLI